MICTALLPPPISITSNAPQLRETEAHILLTPVAVPVEADGNH